MAHKNHWHPSNHSHKHHHGGHHGQEKHDKKMKPEKHKGKPVSQGNGGSGNTYVAGTWSRPILDPSGLFVYIAMRMPDGGFQYQIAGPQAYSNYVKPAYPEPGHRMPNPDVDYNYASSNSNVSYVSDGPVEDPWAAKTLEPVEPGQIRIETYPNNDINIVTPRTSKDSAVRDMVLVVRTDSEHEITPVTSRSAANRSKPRGQLGRRSHASREVNYDDAVLDRRLLSSIKVSDWLSRGPSH